MLTKGEMLWFREHYLTTPDDSASPCASPLRALDLSLLPPVLIQTAEYDPLRDEGKAYADRLSAAGIPVTYRCYEVMIHMALGSEAMSDWPPTSGSTCPFLVERTTSPGPWSKPGRACTWSVDRVSLPRQGVLCHR